MDSRYTRGEVERMMGISRRELDYWTRLRLVSPRSRWGERFFNFSDLVALETIKRLAARRIPARRIQRTILALQAELGSAETPLSSLRVSTNGKQVVVHPPQKNGQPHEPLTGQFVLNFEISELARKVHALSSPSAEEWFEIGMACDSNPDSIEQAAQAYQKAVEASPSWVEARINLGAALFQLGKLEAAYEEFAAACELDPDSPLAEFNLGCVLQQCGEVESAIWHFERAVELSPNLADAHFNLALAYEKYGAPQEEVLHLSLYLRYEPNGPWKEYALSRISGHSAAPASTPRGKLTPFRRKK